MKRVDPVSGLEISDLRDEPATQPPPSPNACPQCARQGKEIPRKVLYQHLDARGILDIFQWKESRVCLNTKCDCLYYSGLNWITHRRANKPVGFKKAEPPRVYCYCFGYTAEEIFKKAEAGQEKLLLDQIADYLQKGALLCQSTNPAGQCCLEMVQELLKSRLA